MDTFYLDLSRLHDWDKQRVKDYLGSEVIETISRERLLVASTAARLFTLSMLRSNLLPSLQDKNLRFHWSRDGLSQKAVMQLVPIAKDHTPDSMKSSSQHNT